MFLNIVRGLFACDDITTQSSPRSLRRHATSPLSLIQRLNPNENRRGRDYAAPVSSQQEYTISDVKEKNSKPGLLRRISTMLEEGSRLLANGEDRSQVSKEEVDKALGKTPNGGATRWSSIDKKHVSPMTLPILLTQKQPPKDPQATLFLQ